MAKEGDDLEEITKAVKQIIKNCLLETVDVDELPIFDIEMFFINLRIKSIGESAEMVYSCNNVVGEGDQTCDHQIEFNMDLRNVTFEDSADHSDIIKLTENTGIKFKYPSLNFSVNSFNDNFEDGGYNFVSEYIDYIYDEEQIYKKNEIDPVELREFFDNLSMEHVNAIRNFFMTAPKVVLNQQVKCPKCSYEHDLHLEGLLNFFE